MSCHGLSFGRTILSSGATRNSFVNAFDRPFCALHMPTELICYRQISYTCSWGLGKLVLDSAVFFPFQATISFLKEISFVLELFLSFYSTKSYFTQSIRKIALHEMKSMSMSFVSSHTHIINLSEWVTMTVVIIYETFCHVYRRFFITRNNVIVKISIKNNAFVPVQAKPTIKLVRIFFQWIRQFISMMNSKLCLTYCGKVVQNHYFVSTDLNIVTASLFAIGELLPLLKKGNDIFES